MRYIPDVFYSDSLIKEIDDYIHSGFNSFHKLKMEDKQRLSGICLELLGDDGYSCIIEPENFSNTRLLLSLILKKSNAITERSLIQVMKENAVEHFSEDLQDLFELRSSEIEVDQMKEAGLRAYQYTDNGEITWVRHA